jgi:hypothetical protein
MIGSFLRSGRISGAFPTAENIDLGHLAVRERQPRLLSEIPWFTATDFYVPRLLRGTAYAWSSA